MAKPANPCDGSQRFPTNFDGEHTRCPVCDRLLFLRHDGLVPEHTPKVKT